MLTFRVHGTRTLGSHTQTFTMRLQADCLADAIAQAENAVWDWAADGAWYSFDVEEFAQQSRFCA